MNYKIAGEYVVDEYGKEKKDWHFVKISIVDAVKGVYKWANKAGKSWTLTKIPNSPDILLVGTDCPHYI